MKSEIFLKSLLLFNYPKFDIYKLYLIKFFGAEKDFDKNKSSITIISIPYLSYYLIYPRRNPSKYTIHELSKITDLFP